MHIQTKILKITPKTHKKLKDYCKKNSLKLYHWAENVLLEKISEKKDDNIQNHKYN